MCVCVLWAGVSPVKTEGVQEGRQPLHDEQDGHGEGGEGGEDYGEAEEPAAAPGGEAQAHHHGPEDLRQLCTQPTTAVFTPPRAKSG